MKRGVRLRKWWAVDANQIMTVILLWSLVASYTKVVTVRLHWKVTEKGLGSYFFNHEVPCEWLASISKIDEAWKLLGQMKVKFAKSADMWSQVEEGLPK